MVNLSRKIGLTLVTVSILGLTYSFANYIGQESRFRNVYHRALFQYADVDHNNIITAQEKDAFDEELLKDKNVSLVNGNRPVYLKTGKIVPTKTLIEWIEDYKPSTEN